MQSVKRVTEAQCAIVVATYKRNELLEKLLLSIAEQTIIPTWVVLVDNDGGALSVAERYRAFPHNLPIVYIESESNGGGAGAFAQGVGHAYDLGAEWLWLIDDDTRLLKNGYSNILSWRDRYKCYIGRRKNLNGEIYHFQSVLNEFLALPIPSFMQEFIESDVFKTNLLSFEGAMIHRSIVDELGPPDPRFFITWDDVTYGWLASKLTNIVVVKDVVLERTKSDKFVTVFGKQFSVVSDLYRYHLVRNRELVKAYFKANGKYSAIGFTLGTVMLFWRELLRGALCGELVASFKSLWRGLRDPNKAEVAQSRVTD